MNDRRIILDNIEDKLAPYRKLANKYGFTLDAYQHAASLTTVLVVSKRISIDTVRGQHEYAENLIKFEKFLMETTNTIDLEIERFK